MLRAAIAPDPWDIALMFELNEVIWKNVCGADSEMPLPIRRFHARY